MHLAGLNLHFLKMPGTIQKPNAKRPNMIENVKLFKELLELDKV